MKQLLCLLLLPLALAAQNKDISYLSSGGKLNPLQAIMDVRHYTLSLDVDIDKHSIQGFTEVAVILSKPSDTLLFDLVHLLIVQKILVNNKAVQYLQQNDKIYITANTAFAAGKQTIKIF